MTITRDIPHMNRPGCHECSGSGSPGPWQAPVWTLKTRWTRSGIILNYTMRLPTPSQNFFSIFYLVSEIFWIMNGEFMSLLINWRIGLDAQLFAQLPWFPLDVYVGHRAIFPFCVSCNGGYGSCYNECYNIIAPRRCLISTCLHNCYLLPVPGQLNSVALCLGWALCPSHSHPVVWSHNNSFVY